MKQVHLQNLFAIMAFCSLAFAGCSEVAYPNTPEGVFRKMLDASIERDIDKAVSTLPTDEELEHLADTPAQLGEFMKKRDESIKKMIDEFTHVNENSHASLHFWYEDDFKCNKIEEVKNGYDIAIAEVSVTVCERRSGEIKRDRVTGQFIRVNGRWINSL